MRPDTDRPNTLKGLSSYPSLAFTVPACRGFVHIFRPHFQPGGLQAGVKSESVLVSRAARNWRPPVRRSRRHRPPPFGLPCRTRPFLRGPLLPGQPRFPFPAVACFPAPKGLRLAVLGTCGERPPGEACGTLGRGPCSRPSPVCVRLEYFNRKNMARKIFSKENDGAQKKSRREGAGWGNQEN